MEKRSFGTAWQYLAGYGLGIWRFECASSATHANAGTIASEAQVAEDEVPADMDRVVAGVDLRKSK